jgi:branched-chain amino acid transport system ATP-binding protein
MKVVVSLCDEVSVLHHGELIARGPSDEITSDPRVIEAYLGERYSKRGGAAAPRTSHVAT